MAVEADDGCHPTACRLAAASAGNHCPKTNDLVREAVGYNGVLGGIVPKSVFR
jgi:hypothetical protein